MKVATRSIMTFLSHDFFNSRTLMHAGYTLILPAGYTHTLVCSSPSGIWVKRKGKLDLVLKKNPKKGLVCHTFTIC